MPDGEPDPRLWLALYVGLLVGDLVRLAGARRHLAPAGLPVHVRQALGAVARPAPVTLLFTGHRDRRASAAVRAEPLTGADHARRSPAASAVAYRAHRRAVAQQHATEKLYDFVKDLGPLDLDDPQAAGALERRAACCCTPSGSTWPSAAGTAGSTLHRRGGPGPRAVQDGVRHLSRQVAATRTAALRQPASAATSDTMATPLLGAGRAARHPHRHASGSGAARGFDMGDLRLLETVGAELSTALERGRLHADLERAATTDTLTGLHNLRGDHPPP